MDTRQTKSPLKRWLVLSLLVLLAHLGLLQSMPLGLNPGASVVDPAMAFTTRSIAAPELSPDPIKPTTVVAARPRPPARPKAAPETPQPATENTTARTDESANSASDGPRDNAELQASAQATTVASAPEPVVPPQPQTPPKPADTPQEKPPSFSAESLNGSSRLIYKVHANKFPFSLNAELVWRNLGNSYSARLSFSAFGQNRSQTSRGQITDVGLAPERFADKYRSEVAAHFNYAESKVTFSANTPDVPLLSGAQDRLSVLVQLGALVASEPARYVPGTTLTVQTVGPRAADLWLFTFGEMEALEVPGGHMQGLKLVRIPRDPYDQKVEVWLAPKLGYLPARIRITETNGDAIDQQWLSSEPITGAEVD